MTTKHRVTEADALRLVEDDETVWTEVSDGDERRAIREAIRLRDEARQRLDEAVVRGRRQGLTWMEIGSALGISHQAARKKYAPLV